MKMRAIKFCCLVIGLLLCGSMISEIFLYSQNTVLNNGRWIAAKRKLGMYIMGADEFLITRIPLAGNSLNLGAWHGHQEVSLRNPVNFGRIKFDFEIPEGSYLDIVVDKGGETLQGIRLSRSEVYPQGFFQSNTDGRIIQFQPIAAKAILPGWHQAAISFPGKGITLQINGEPPVQIESKLTRASELGFRAGLAGAKIDDIVAKGTEGGEFKDTFRNGNDWLKLAALHSILLAAPLGAVCCLLWMAMAWQLDRILGWSLIIVSQIFVCSSIYYAFDFFYWSKKPFQTQMRLLSNLNRPIFSE